MKEKMKGIKVLYEDNHIIVVNKPAGVLSQKDITSDDSIIEILKDYIKVKYNKPGNVFLGSVHRLDRPVSGVMVFAKTSKALTRLNNAIKSRQFGKEYLAVLEGKMSVESGILVHHLVKDTRKNIVKAYKKPVDKSKKAELKFNLIGIYNDFSFVKINLFTGRSHQIRAQFSNDFFPIVGDFKYGSKTKIPDRSISLHSYKLSFEHPVQKKRMTFTVKPDFSQYIWKKFMNFFD